MVKLVQWAFQVKHIKWKDNLITNYLSRKPPVINTTVIPSPLCVYPTTDLSSSSDPSSSLAPIEITYMIESLPPDIKDQIKTLTLEARSKRIIKVLMMTLNNTTTIFLPFILNQTSHEKPFLPFG